MLDHGEQVAQLWQTDHASSINDFRWGSIWGYYRHDMTQFTLTHHMVNKPFLLLGLAAEYRSRRRRRCRWCDKHCGRPSDVYDTGELSWQRLRSWDDQPLTFTQKTKNCSLSHPLGHLGVWLVGKPVVDFIFVVIELFSLSPTVETLWAEIEVGVFRRWVGHFERRFQREGGIAHQPLLVSE